MILGAINTIQSLVGIVLQIFGGAIADRWGRKRIIGFMTVMASLSYIFYIFADNWLWILFGALMLSVTYLYVPALQALRAESVSPSERGRGFVLFNVLPEVPAVLAPAIGGLLINNEASKYGISIPGIKLCYSFLFLGAMTAGLIRLFFLKETFREDFKLKVSGVAKPLTLIKEWYEAIVHSDPYIKKLILLNGFLMFCFNIDVLFRSIYAVNIKGLQAGQWGVIVSISQGVMIVAGIFIGGLIDKYGRKKVFIPSVLALGVSSIIFIFGGGFFEILLAMILINIGTVGRMMSLQVLIADSTPMRIRGRIFSAITALGTIGMAISYLMSGTLFDFKPVLPFIASMITYLTAAVVSSIILKEARFKYA